MRPTGTLWTRRDLARMVAMAGAAVAGPRFVPSVNAQVADPIQVQFRGATFVVPPGWEEAAPFEEAWPRIDYWFRPPDHVHVEPLTFRETPLKAATRGW